MNVKPSTVVVALSGGVDSALAAALLKKRGWEVCGLHFLLPVPPAKRKAKMASAGRIAGHLQIPISFLDLEETFNKRVIDPFIDSYLSGLTPNPCVWCNQVVKFDRLLDYTRRMEIEHIATGHYAEIRRGEGSRVELWRGKDKTKEQTYFLHRLNAEHLSKIVFPLGNMLKKEARHLAADLGLPDASEPESQEICFVPENDYRLFLELRRGYEIARRGEIIDREGQKLGEHSGVYRYTIGQRHGLGIASHRPYYVMEIRPYENQIVVGRREELLSTHVEAHGFNWLMGGPPQKGMAALAQIRYRHKPAPGRLEVISPKEARFRFDEPQWAITPGQALVCYEGDKLLGGGWIRKTEG